MILFKHGAGGKGLDRLVLKKTKKDMELCYIGKKKVFIEQPYLLKPKMRLFLNRR